MLEYPMLIIYMAKSSINPFPWFLLFYVTSHNLNLKRIASASVNRNQCIIISILRNMKWISSLKIKCITCIIWMAFRIASNYCNDNNNAWIRNLLPLKPANEWKRVDNQVEQFCTHSEINAKWKLRIIRFYLPTTNNGLYCFKSHLFWLHSRDW